MTVLFSFLKTIILGPIRSLKLAYSAQCQCCLVPSMPWQIAWQSNCWDC